MNPRDASLPQPTEGARSPAPLDDDARDPLRLDDDSCGSVPREYAHEDASAGAGISP